MSPETYKLLTDALIVFHFAFVAFVMIGGLLTIRWNRLAFLHIPCVLWVIWIETSGNLCPLTPLENELRDKAGLTTYEGGFVDHYIMPVLYPKNLTRDIQMNIAAGLIVINLASYGLIGILRYRRRRLALQRSSECPVEPPAEQVPVVSIETARVTPAALSDNQV